MRTWICAVLVQRAGLVANGLWRRRLVLALIAVSLALLVPAAGGRPASASGLPLTLIARQGDAISFPAGSFRPASSGTLKDFGAPAVRDDGTVAVLASAESGGFPRPCAVVKGSGGSLTQIAVDYDEAPLPSTPGTKMLRFCDTAGVLSPDLATDSFRPESDSSAGDLFAARVVTPPAPGTGSATGLFLRPPVASPLQVALEGSSGSPLFGGACGKPQSFGMSSDGRVLFKESGGSSPEALVLTGTGGGGGGGGGACGSGTGGGGTVKISAVGDAATGVGGETFTAYTGLSINQAGDVAFTGTTSGGKTGVWKWTRMSATLSLVIVDGATWFQSNRIDLGAITLSSFSEPEIATSSGAIIFRATGSAGYGSGYFLKDVQTDPQKLTLVKDPPPIPSTGSWASLTSSGNAYAYSNGQIVLNGSSSGGSGIFGLPLGFSVILAGQATPAGSTLASASSYSVSPNPGNISITASTTGAGISPCPSALPCKFVANLICIGCVVDTDKDGISDADEAAGRCGIGNPGGTPDYSLVNIDGDAVCDVNPAVPDIIVEADYMDCTVAADGAAGLPADCLENGFATCADTVNNGGADGIDSADPDCHTGGNLGNPYDPTLSEDGVITTCNNGVDDDGLNGADGADPTCHTHKPSAAAIANVKAGFAGAPLAGGVKLHVIVDEALAHKNYLDFPAGDGRCGAGGAGVADFNVVKAQHFGTVAEQGNANLIVAKKTVAHYALFVHMMAAGDTHSGCAEMWGNDFYVALGGWGAAATQGTVEGTFMHELGHNLDLCHGGPAHLVAGAGGAEQDGQCGVNYKPNFLSVMNYTFQTPNTPDGQATGRPLDYSRFTLAPLPGAGMCPPPAAPPAPSLNETKLDEGCGIDDTTPPAGLAARNTAYTYSDGGLCRFAVVPATGAIDWNKNNVIEGGSQVPATANVGAEINDWPMFGSGCDGALNETLVGYNDWPNLHYDFKAAPGGAGDGLPHAPIPVGLDATPPPDIDGDGFVDGLDNCPAVANSGQQDTDSDGRGDACDNCPTVANANQANQDSDPYGDACEQPQCVTVPNFWVVPPGDSDCDSFTDTQEVFVGTDPADGCAATPDPDDEQVDPDVWPVDFDDNQRVLLFDVTQFAHVYGAHANVPSQPYDVRYDFTGDGLIGLGDVTMFAQVYGKHCTP